MTLPKIPPRYVLARAILDGFTPLTWVSLDINYSTMRSLARSAHLVSAHDRLLNVSVYRPQRESFLWARMVFGDSVKRRAREEFLRKLRLAEPTTALPSTTWSPFAAPFVPPARP